MAKRCRSCGIFPLVFGGWAEPACKWHDAAYTKGSWAQEWMSRKRVDEHFLQLLLELSGSNPLKRTTSYAMYAAVRAVGGMWWEGKN